MSTIIGRRSRTWFCLLRVSRCVLFLLAIFSAAALPRNCFACACGCGVFDVGTSSNFATCPGPTVFFEYDYMNQNQNWHGTSSAPSQNNDDKRIRSNFFVAGYQYFFNREWGMEVTLPYTNRLFKTEGDNGAIDSYNHSNFGDIRLKAIYSGFSDDMSSAVSLGVKLANGDYTYPNFDRDTEIGSGSTDATIGGYHIGQLTDDNMFDWYTNSELDVPMLTSEGYRPGTEFDSLLGVYYNGFQYGDVKIAPVAQAALSVRWYDRGPNADSTNTGYERLILEPGFEVDFDKWKLFADIGFPVAQDFRGDQLTAHELYTINLSRNF